MESFCIFVIFCIFFTCSCGQLQCTKNCSIVSAYGKMYTIYYSIKNKQCRNISTPENIPPSDPVHVGKDFRLNGWYLYDDPDDSRYQKIALNFTWTLREYGSAQYLRGYFIRLQNNNELTSDNIYFCFLNQITFHQLTRIKFYYDGFGYNDHWNLQPHQEWDVYIVSLPESSISAPVLSTRMMIPGCAHSALARVRSCQQVQKKITVSYVKRNCSEHSAVLEYNVPHSYGKFATLALDVTVSSSLSPKTLHAWKNQPLKGNITVTLPANSNISAKYSLVVWGDKQKRNRVVKYFNFTDCVFEKSSASSNKIDVITVAVISAIVLVILTLIFVGIKCFWKDPRHFCETLFSEPEYSEKTLPLNSVNFNEETVIEEPLNKHTKVYVIFFDDHPKHTEVVVKFVNYLIGDLTFDVIFELYETKQVYTDPISWMMKSLEKSDKVVVIWSPGAAKKWHSSEKSRVLEHDFFTPVLKKIKDDLFLQKNLSKYIFVYFDYVSIDDIPAEFFELYSHLHFKLMQQLTDFYFRLIGKERFYPGVEFQENKAVAETYFDEKATGNKHGSILHCRIKEMIAHAENNHNWYDEKALKQAPQEKQSIAGGKDIEVVKNCLKVVPPESTELSCSIEFQSEMLKLSAMPNSLNESLKFDAETEREVALFKAPASLCFTSLPENQEKSAFLMSKPIGEYAFNAQSTSSEDSHSLSENNGAKTGIFPSLFSSVESDTCFCKDACMQECKLTMTKPLAVECSANDSPCDSGFASKTSPISPSLLQLAPLEKVGNPMDILVSINERSEML